MRRRSTWPSKITPYRSNASRSNQLLEFHTSVRDGTTGNSSSGQNTLSRTRQFSETDSRWETTQKRPPAQAWSLNCE